MRCSVRTYRRAAAVCGLALATAAVSLAVGGTPSAVQADEASGFDMSSWTAEADCSLCHPSEVASFEAAENEGGAGAGSPAEAAAKGGEAPARDGGDGASSAGADAPDGSAAAEAASAAAEAGTAGAGADAKADAGSAAGPHATGGLLAQTHGFGCTACHDEEALTELHRTTDKASRKASLKLKDAVSNEACLACHGSYEELAEKTAGSAYLTDDHGLTVNPHDVPESSGHDDPVACTSCHSVHKEYEPIRYCYGCHHADVFECGTCHAV